MGTNAYIITYDVANSEDFDYGDLMKAIKAYGVWAHITESTWAVVTDEAASTIANYLLGFMPENSRVFVVRSGSEATWSNVICRDSWLKKRL